MLALSPMAEAYYEALRLRDLYALGQARRILMLADIHGREPVAAALEEAHELGAYSSDYLRNILEHRQSLAPLFGELRLIRGNEHLDLVLPPPDCSRFETPTETDNQPSL